MRTELIQVLEEGVEASQVAQQIVELGVQNDAFFVLDLGDVVRKHEEWRRQMPRVRPHYAVKTHNNTTVLSALAALGIGFDCATKSEIEHVLGLGVEPARIIFSHTAKAASHIKYAATHGVDLMVFDNVIELRKILAIQPAAKLVLRFRCDTAGTTLQMGKKFGCEPLVEAPQLLSQAFELGGNVVGVSVHCGNRITDTPVFRRALLYARGIFDAAEKMGMRLTMVDLGGGYPGHSGSSIADIASVVNETLVKEFPPEVDIIAEPGTFYVDSAFTLYTQIVAKREVTEVIGKHFMYFVNDGVFGSLMCQLFFKVFPEPTTLRKTSGAAISSSLWGPTCSNADVVNQHLFLPELDPGDWLVFKDTGAYTRVLATSFNGVPVTRVHIVVDKATWLALKDKFPMKAESFVTGNNPKTLLLGLIEDETITHQDG